MSGLHWYFVASVIFESIQTEGDRARDGGGEIETENKDTDRRIVA